MPWRLNPVSIRRVQNRANIWKSPLRDHTGQRTIAGGFRSMKKGATHAKTQLAIGAATINHRLPDTISITRNTIASAVPTKRSNPAVDSLCHER